MSTTGGTNLREDIREPRFGFWRRSVAMLIKEFIQLRRDRVSFIMIVMLPLMQLILFGYAINTTPRNLPTAVLLQESSDVGRSILAALQNTQYFRVTHQLRDAAEFDSLLAMPITPVEIMLGKIVPYVVVGFVQAAMIIGVGALLFGVPVLGSLALLAGLSTLFITANLSIGYTFSTIAQNQLQAMQMSMMFFLPNILLSGFMFPFAGMPDWAQWIGEALPLTHYIRIVRAIMLKGSSFDDLRYDALILGILMLIAMASAVTRFRRTLD